MSGGKRSRDKGQRGEREAASLLAASFPGARRGCGQARNGSDAADVEGTPWWVEVKSVARIAALRFLEQADAATDGRPPVVLMRECRRGHRSRWVAMLDLATLLTLAEAATRPGSLNSDGAATSGNA